MARPRDHCHSPSLSDLASFTPGPITATSHSECSNLNNITFFWRKKTLLAAHYPHPSYDSEHHDFFLLRIFLSPLLGPESFIQKYTLISFWIVQPREVDFTGTVTLLVAFVHHWHRIQCSGCNSAVYCLLRR